MKNEITYYHGPAITMHGAWQTVYSPLAVCNMHDIILHIKLITDICKVNTYKLRRIVCYSTSPEPWTTMWAQVTATARNETKKPKRNKKNYTESLVLNSFSVLFLFISKEKK